MPPKARGSRQKQKHKESVEEKKVENLKENSEEEEDLSISQKLTSQDKEEKNENENETSNKENDSSPEKSPLKEDLSNDESEIEESEEEDDEDDYMNTESSKQRLFELKMKINEGRQANKEALRDHLAESHKPFWRTLKEEKLKKKIENERLIEEARKRGEDAPIDDMNTPLVLIEDKIEDVKNKEENKNVNKYNRQFVNIEATRLAYKKREKEMNPDIDEYRSKKALGITRASETKEKAEAFIKSLEKENERKGKFHRHRMQIGALLGQDLDEEAEEDVDYIHSDNQRLNERLRRSYGKAAAEYKASFDRGTAV